MARFAFTCAVLALLIRIAVAGSSSLPQQDIQSEAVIRSSEVQKAVVRRGASSSVETRRASFAVGASGTLSRSKSELEKKADESMYEGLERTDSFKFNRGIDCFQGFTATANTNMSLPECQTACVHDDDCRCISFTRSSGTCHKMPGCNPQDCAQSSLVDTYMLHSKFKVSSGSLSHVAANYGGEESGPQVSFDRAGARSCRAAKMHSTFSGLSVSQCLSKCMQESGCTCVRYERYYQQECSLMAGCPAFYGNPDVVYDNACPRDTKHDMYHLQTEAPTLSPTYSPTVSPTQSPTDSPTFSPTATPTQSPTDSPTHSPTPSPTQVMYPYRAWVSEVWHNEGWISSGWFGLSNAGNGRCHEASTEEFSMKLKLHFVDQSGRNEHNDRWGDCVQCSRNGDCSKTHHNGGTIAGVAGTSTGINAGLEIEMEAFENDHGSRCWADWGDDCHARERCIIPHDRNYGTREFKCPNKPRCHGSSHGCTDHQITIQFRWD